MSASSDGETEEKIIDHEEGGDTSKLLPQEEHDDEVGSDDDVDDQTRIQVTYALLLLVKSLASVVANNLEVVYIGHIRGDAYTGQAQMAAWSIGASADSWYGGAESLWGGLTAQIGHAFGARDTVRVKKLMRMAYTTALLSGLLVWVISYSLTPYILRNAFDPEPAVYDYAVNFVYMHMSGNLAMYIHNAQEQMIRGLQHMKVFTAISLMRSFYMALSNYFTVIVFDGFGMGGLFGEAMASSSRNHFVFILCTLFLFRSTKTAKFRGLRQVNLVQDDWRPFLCDGAALLAMHYAGSASRFINPILTSRLGTIALGARIITSHIAMWPSTISTVLNTLVTVLGSKYLGQRKVELYHSFIGRLFCITLSAALFFGFGFWAVGDYAYMMYTDDSDTLEVCRSCTLVLICGFLAGISGSVVTGMVYAAQEFRWLAAIQIVTELVVYLPIVWLVQSNYFGELSLPKLLWVEFVVELSRIALQAVVAVRSLRRARGPGYSQVAGGSLDSPPSSDVPDEPKQQERSVYSP